MNSGRQYTGRAGADRVPRCWPSARTYADRIGLTAGSGAIPTRILLRSSDLADSPEWREPASLAELSPPDE
jgi:hypothetical protein